MIFGEFTGRITEATIVGRITEGKEALAVVKVKIEVELEGEQIGLLPKGVAEATACLQKEGAKIQDEQGKKWVSHNTFRMDHEPASYVLFPGCPRTNGEIDNRPRVAVVKGSVAVRWTVKLNMSPDQVKELSLHVDPDGEDTIEIHRVQLSLAGLEAA